MDFGIRFNGKIADAFLAAISLDSAYSASSVPFRSGKMTENLQT